MRKLFLVAGAVALLGFVAGEAEAQVKVGFGAHASFATEVDLGLGARANFDLAAVENLAIVPSFDIHFPGNGGEGISNNWMEFSVNAHYSFPLADNPGLLPYAGGGLTHVRNKVKVTILGISDSYTATDTGLNLIGGVKFPQFGSFVPFGELRYSTAGPGQLYLTGGINF